jgi:hypothetical protein
VFYFKRFLPFESSGDTVHVEKSGCFNFDVVLKYLLIRVGEIISVRGLISLLRTIHHHTNNVNAEHGAEIHNTID